MSYLKAREMIFRNSQFVMRLKEYYNILARVIDRTRVDETTYAFYAVFDKEGWKYCLRVRGDGSDRKIV